MKRCSIWSLKIMLALRHKESTEKPKSSVYGIELKTQSQVPDIRGEKG